MSTENTNGKRIYIKSSKTWMPVTDEQYKDHMRECDRVRKKMQNHHACSCPRSNFWECDGCCDDCRHQVKGSILSMDAPMGTDDSEEEFSLYDIVGDPRSEFEDTVVNQMFYRAVIKRLKEIYPQAIEIGNLRIQGKTDEEIAEIIGVKRTTFRSRIARAKEQIFTEFGIDLFD
jgi:DNA-directed RNA polymerase specialized sigma24 family protein